ncbi:MAG: transposase, partial [Silvanigrellaceae bacterium]|nr:transposase [Silvanigrellaceae bacterium]
SNKIEPNKVILLILDVSKVHRNNILHIPKNIKFHFLPPYSPELNPIERLWLFIKNNYLSFKLCKDFLEIEAAGCNAWNNISAKMVKSICKYQFPPKIS